MTSDTAAARIADLENQLKGLSAVVKHFKTRLVAEQTKRCPVFANRSENDRRYRANKRKVFCNV